MQQVASISTDVFGDDIQGVVWTFPNREGGEDKVISRNLFMYLDHALGAKKAVVLEREGTVFYEKGAWYFLEDGYTVAEDDLDNYLEWAYGASKEYV